MVLFTDVSEQPIGPIFKGQAVRGVKSQKTADLIYTATEVGGYSKQLRV
jgi:hypothetical protein